MAIKIPTAVAISASDRPAETTAKPLLPEFPIYSKDLMMPITVPNSPIKGERVAIVPNNQSLLFMTS